MVPTTTIGLSCGAIPAICSSTLVDALCTSSSFFSAGINPSTWTVRGLCTDHFAVSDIETKQHQFFSTQQSSGERLIRRRGESVNGMERQLEI